MRKRSIISRTLESLIRLLSGGGSNEASKGQSGENNIDQLISSQSSFTPEKILQALHVEVLEKGDDGYYMVGFQGGVFMFFFEKERLNMMYNDILECNYMDSVKASLVANDINSAYSVWSCYLRYATEENTPVKVCFSQMVFLLGDFKQTIRTIYSLLTSVFALSRDFKERFKMFQDDQTDLTTLLNQKDFVHKLEVAKRQIELEGFDNLKEEMPPTWYLQIETLSELFEDSFFGSPKSLRIIQGNEVELVEGADAVTKFDIRAYIRNHPSPENLDNLTFIAAFQMQDLIVNLKQMPGSSKNSLFFSMNVMRSGVEEDTITQNNSNVSFRDTVEVRLTTEQSDYWEVKYMLDEAREKASKGDVGNLNEEQKMLLIQLTPRLQEDLYWGFKYFNEDCMHQALFYFKRIYHHFRLHQKKDFDKQFRGDISLYLGIIYSRLKRFELAYYYLNHANKYESIIASEWFVNCLCNLHASSTATVIARMIKNITLHIEKSDISESLRKEYYKFYLFLQRRMAQTFISNSLYDEAENLLNQMIEDDENVEFCQEELERIQQLRSEEDDDKKDGIR